MKKDIKQIIKKAKAGDKRAFENLYKETYDRNYYMVFKMLKNEQDVLDVLQETYIKIFTKLDQYTYTGENSFFAWTGKIATNTALDFLRKKNPVLFTEMEEVCEDKTVEFDIEDPSEAYRPDIVYDKKETADIVEEMLACLSEEQRICVLLFYLQEMSIKEVAEFCNCSENTIKSRLHYARKKIREQGELMKKRGIFLMGIAPFAWLISALEQDAMAAQAPAIALEMCGEILKGTFIQLGTANKAGVAVATIGKGSALAKIGAGKVLVLVTAGSLGVGVATGIWIGRNQPQPDSQPLTEQVTTEKVITTTEMTTTVTTTEMTTEQMTTQEKPSETQTTEAEAVTQEKTTEKIVSTTEATTEKKTTATTEFENMEWDDNYIEWDE